MNLVEIGQQDFGTLTEPYRRELQAHCYRMMGSIQDAEDMVQETFLRAWRRRETFEARASLRSWLYKIATNACLDRLKRLPRRVVPITYQEVSIASEPIPKDVLEPIWLEPYPDDLLGDESPEEDFSSREHITLAFIVALQLLPPRQRAVLILRDVLDWQANEVADLLEMTVPAVKSALHRARSTLENHEMAENQSLDEATRMQLEGYVRAWETADVDSLLKLLKDDATFSMPPIPAWYRGRDEIRMLVFKTIFAGNANGRWRLLPTHANRQVAFGLYRQSETPDVYKPYAIQVLTFQGGLIADITTFRNSALFQYFGLPATAS